MKWIKQYRNYILKYSSLLEKASFSYIDEDDFSIKYTDGDIRLIFSVERYSDTLDISVEYLGDDQLDNYRYSLFVLIKVCSDQIIELEKIDEPFFKMESEQEKEQLVKKCIEFVVKNKKRCFGKVFPFAKEYHEYSRSLLLKLTRKTEE